MLVILLLPVLCPPAAATPCSNAALSTALQEVQAASLRIDEGADAALVAAIEEARGRFECMQELVEPGLAARYHHFQALTSFLEGDLDQCVDSFLAGRLAEPSQIPDLAGWPEQHPLRTCYERSARATPEPEGRAHSLAEGWIAIDGRPLAQRNVIPSGRAYVVQWWAGHDTDEALAVVRDTTYVSRSDRPPGYLAPSPARRRGLLEAGLGVGLLGGLSLVGSIPAKQAAERAARDGDAERYDGLVSANHALFVGGAVAAGGGAALALAARF